MADPRLFRLRVTFHETGRLAMLSHLELARALERAVRRAQLPFAVSQGFSPHMRIAFGRLCPWGWEAPPRYSICSSPTTCRRPVPLRRCRRRAPPICTPRRHATSRRGMPPPVWRCR